MKQTFMFTDIEGSSRLWANDPDRMSEFLSLHDRILSDIITSHHGRIVKHTGDGVFAVFENPSDAASSALEIQLVTGSNEILEGRIRLRIGIHKGFARERDGDLFGPDINLTARVMAAALGGQILLTADAAAPVPPEGASHKNLGLHNLKDIAEPRRLFLLAHPGLVERYSLIPKTLTVPNNLPAEQTPFVGREAEMIRISALIGQEDCRLLTLLGPGGSGKTRLSIRTATEIGHRFRDGVFFVPLAEITESDDIAPRIAYSIGFSTEDGGDLEKALQEHLKDREMLLVLDNFEQLTSGASILAGFLESSQDLRILVTSRERLRLRAEWVFEVPGMEIPPDGTHAEGFDSVELFLKTAQRGGGSPHGEKDYPVITRICRLLEGSPLAIELAASWCGMLPVEEIEEQVRDPASLESLMRDHPERHSSLEAVFRFSWNLLDDDHRKALCSLTVFRGGFDRKAASEVCGIGLAALIALRDRSLIWQIEKGFFGIHGSIRYFASELSGDVLDDPEAIRRSHAEYYLELIAASEEDLVHGDRSSAIHSLERDLDNIRAAWSHAVSNRRAGLMLGSLKGVSTILGVKGQFRELERLLNRAIEALEGTEGNDLVMANLLAELGWAGSHIHSLEICEPPLLRSIELYRNVGDPKGLLDGLNTYANLLNVHAEDTRAEPLYRESLELSKKIGNLHGTAAVLSNLGTLAERQGDLDAARDMYRESIDICRKTGNRHGLSIGLTNLSIILREKGDLDGSLSMLTEALTIEEEIGDDLYISIINTHRMELLFILGRLDEARQLCIGSIVCFETQGHIWMLVRGKFLLALIELEEGNIDSGAERLLEAMDIYSTHMRQVCMEELIAVSAICLSLRGQHKKACSAAAAAFADDNILPGYMQARLEGVIERAREALTPDAFRECTATARSLDKESALSMVRKALIC